MPPPLGEGFGIPTRSPDPLVRRDGEYYTPTLRLAMWPAWRVGKHKGAQTVIGPSQAPSRSLETARLVGCVLRPGAKISGSQPDLLTPSYDVWAKIIRGYPNKHHYCSLPPKHQVHSSSLRAKRLSNRERVLFIGTQFSILYTSMYSPAEAATPRA